MKCPKCGYEQAIYDDINEWWHCPQCHGNGEVEMTNEEYIRSCTFEELAEILTKAILDEKRFRMTVVGGVSETKHWLKEIRK